MGMRVGVLEDKKMFLSEIAEQNNAEFVTQYLASLELQEADEFQAVHSRVLSWLNNKQISAAQLTLSDEKMAQLALIIQRAFQEPDFNLETRLTNWYFIPENVSLNGHQWGEIEHIYALGIVTDIDNVYPDGKFILPPNTKAGVADELQYAAKKIPQGEATFVIPYSNDVHWQLHIATVKDGKVVTQQNYNPPGDGKCMDHAVKRALQEIDVNNAITRAKSGSEIRSAIQTEIKSAGLGEYTAVQAIKKTNPSVQAKVRDCFDKVSEKGSANKVDQDTLFLQLSKKENRGAQKAFDKRYANALALGLSNKAAWESTAASFLGTSAFTYANLSTKLGIFSSNSACANEIQADYKDSATFLSSQTAVC